MTRLCSIEGCGKPHLARGWCRMHWNRWRWHGEPTHQPKKGAPIKFLESLLGTAELGCISWPHAVANTGYGSVLFDGKRRSAHRVMCLLAHGEPPSPEHLAAHRCGNGQEGRCVNPNHLYWATWQQNAADRVEHGKSGKGELNHNAKLTAQDVTSIRSLVDGGRTRTAVAHDYGVSLQCVSRICARKSWAHVK